MLDVMPLEESSINPITLLYLNLPPNELMSDDCEYVVNVLVTDVINSDTSDVAFVL